MRIFLVFYFFLVPTLLQADELPDQIQNGFSIKGSWEEVAGGYYGNYRVTDPSPANMPKKTATWKIQVPVMGRSYRIQATWTPNPVNARNAKFSVFDGTRMLQIVTVNQQRMPRGERSERGVIFQDLGTFLIASSFIKVELSNEASGRVVADSVRVKQ